jgi:putative hydrolase of the HAD superfamily
MVKAVVFDLGNTLITSPFPLNWQKFYSDAIIETLRSIGLEADNDKLKKGESILLKYNTRVNPREYEIDCHTIFTELFDTWGINDRSKIEPAKDTFADFFLGKSELFPNSIPLLEELKKKVIKTGILTNAAYGMGRKYFDQNTKVLSKNCDIFLTSVEIGFRKPNPRGYHELARRLELNTSDCLFVGDEEVDIKGANASGMISVLNDRNGNNKQYGQVYTLSSLDDILRLI